MVLPSIGQNKCYGNTIFIVTSVFALKMADHSEIHRHPEEEDVPTAFILPNRWQYHAESLVVELSMFSSFNRFNYRSI